MYVPHVLQRLIMLEMPNFVSVIQPYMLIAATGY